ncbi:hypothetical protein PCE1_002091 [Barthelona sp. PCE]
MTSTSFAKTALTGGQAQTGVINHELIEKSVREYEKRQNALESVHIFETTVLELSFKNILTIQNLRPFTSLKKLQLDNNSITKIENLETLTQLEWLDLSFNKIKRIEGLDSLVKLKTLSFFNNEISHIEGLENLHDLEVLNLGKNKLTTSELSSFLQFRQFPNLRIIITKENELGETSNDFLIAFLPNLRYLNYKLVQKHQRAGAIELEEGENRR